MCVEMDETKRVFILKVDVVFARGKGGVCVWGGDLTPTACSRPCTFQGLSLDQLSVNCCQRRLTEPDCLPKKLTDTPFGVRNKRLEN